MMRAQRDDSNTNLSLWHKRCLEWQERDLENALAHFTFIAHVTALAPDCRFAGDDGLLGVY